MKYQTSSVLLITPLLLCLSGCALLHPPKPRIQYVHARNDPSMVHLNQIAEKSERSTQILAEIQMAQADSNITLQGAKNARLAMTATPKGWGTRTNVSFQGPFNKIIYTLALRAGYQFFTQGMRPANIPIVTIDAKSKTLKQILDQVISQLPSFISVAIYPRTRSVIIDYHNGR
jgi:hypothetical protein